MRTISIIALLAALILGGCSSQNSGFGFGSSDCNEVFDDCMSSCIRSGKSRNECLGSCQKSRSMCKAMKTKGCMMECVERFGQGTRQAEQCKRRCR